MQKFQTIQEAGIATHTHVKQIGVPHGYYVLSFSTINSAFPLYSTMAHEQNFFSSGVGSKRQEGVAIISEWPRSTVVRQ